MHGWEWLAGTIPNAITSSDAMMILYHFRMAPNGRITLAVVVNGQPLVPSDSPIKHLEQ